MSELKHNPALKVEQNDYHHQLQNFRVLGVAFLQNAKEKAHPTILTHAYNISVLLCCSTNTVSIWTVQVNKVSPSSKQQW